MHTETKTAAKAIEISISPVHFLFQAQILKNDPVNASFPSTEQQATGTWNAIKCEPLSKDSIRGYGLLM